MTNATAVSRAVDVAGMPSHCVPAAGARCAHAASESAVTDSATTRDAALTTRTRLTTRRTAEKTHLARHERLQLVAPHHAPLAARTPREDASGPLSYRGTLVIAPENPSAYPFWLLDAEEISA